MWPSPPCVRTSRSAVIVVLRDEARRAAVAAITASRIAVPVGRLLVRVDEREPQEGATTTWGTGSDIGAHVAVLAHWDARGRFGEPARQTARALRDAGFEVVVVSTATVDHAGFAAEVGADATAVVTRPNVGFDFASWAAGLELLRRADARPERLVLLNSSMYGPVTPIGPMLDRLYATGADVMGATESREFRPHLQSWFLAFTRRAWESERFVRYWRHVRPATDKWGTILAHEQRWATDLAPSGTRPAVAVTTRMLRTRRNPLTFTWREVVLAGVPFVKRSLFLDNYDRVDLTGWQEFLAEHAPGFDVGIVERDVARLTDGAA
jgi:O-antigen biosynthesis protein